MSPPPSVSVALQRVSLFQSYLLLFYPNSSLLANPHQDEFQRLQSTDLAHPHLYYAGGTMLTVLAEALQRKHYQDSYSTCHGNAEEGRTYTDYFAYIWYTDGVYAFVPFS